MLVTRTKLGLEVQCLVADVKENTLKDYTAYIGKVDSKKVEKEVKKVLPEDIKFVSVKAVTECNKLFGLDEAKFMELAIELDPKTRKPLNAPTDAPAEETVEAVPEEAPKKNRK